MARNFDLDTAAAKEANSGGKRITEHGVYAGVFKQAWYEANDKGTESVNFTFLADNGQEAGPLVLYTHKGNGEELPSNKTLHAILACMKLRGIKAERGPVSLWDFDAKAEVSKTKDVYPVLANKRIGLVLTTEDYDGQNGVKQRIVIGAPFAADSRQMAEEVLNSKPAESLDKYTGWLDKTGRWHKPLSGKQGGSQASPAASTQAMPASTFQDDDIPF